MDGIDGIDRTTGHSWIAPAAMVAGGVLGAVGPVMTWTAVSVQQVRDRFGGRVGGRAGLLFPGKVPGGRSGPHRLAGELRITGLHTPGGRLILGLCLALVVVAVLAWVAASFWVRAAAFAVGLTLGLVALVLAVVDAVSSPGVRGLAGIGPSASAGPGVFFALVGSAAATAAAAGWFVSTRDVWAQGSKATPPAAPPPEPVPAAS